MIDLDKLINDWQVTVDRARHWAELYPDGIFKEQLESAEMVLEALRGKREREDSP